MTAASQAARESVTASPHAIGSINPPASIFFLKLRLASSLHIGHIRAKTIAR